MMASCTRCDALRSESLDKADWENAVAEAVRCPAELCRLLDLDPALAEEARAAAGHFPLLVPRAYVSRMQRGNRTDPLLVQVLPQRAENSPAVGYSTDPLGESEAVAAPGLLRKYKSRTLMVSTGSCAVHCRFCFRRHFPCAEIEADPGAALRAVAADPSIHEVILSGGDPLMLRDAELASLLADLSRISHLHRLRIHSRMPIVIPSRITGELVDSVKGGAVPVIVVVHVNHPAEIDADVAAGFARLVDAGIPVLSQSVLLRGVNDRASVLAELFERLVDLRAMPYYLHQLDRVAGAAHFEVPAATGIALVQQLRTRLPGYAVPRYVREMPGGAFKEPLA